MKNIILAIIVLISLTAGATSEATFTIIKLSESSPAEVSLVVPSQRINEADTFEIKINIDPKGTPIAGAQTNFLFNKSVIRVNSVSEGNLFRQYGASTYYFITNIDNQYGVVNNIVDVIIGPYNISTPGTFAIINVTAIGTGSSNLNLSHVLISSPESQPVPLYTVNQSLSSYSISDINGDWTTDLMDIVSVSQHFGETAYYPYPSYDANKDGTVNILDIIMVARKII